MLHFHDDNIKIIENTLSSTHFNGINYYIKGEEHSAAILYYSEDEQIDDPDASFLFINHLPEGNYAHYLYIETSTDAKIILAKIQNDLLTSILPETSSHFFANITPDYQSLGNIIKLASHMVNNPIMLSTTTYEIIEMCDNDISFRNPIWNETARTGTCSPALVEQFESSGITEKVMNEETPVLWSLDTMDDCPKISSKITYAGEVLAYLSVFVINEDSMDDAFSIFRELNPVLTSILSKSTPHISDRCQMTCNFVYRLLEDKVDNIATETADLDLHLSNYRLVCVTNKQRGTIYNYSYYLNILLKEDITGTFYKGKLILLIAERPHMDTYLKHLCETYFPKHYYLFVSEMLYHLEETAKITPMMLHFSNYVFHNESVIFTSKYLHVLYAPIQTLYHAGYHRLETSSNKDLKETLIQYIEHNLNVSETAAALFIHRNTLFYRLQRITNDYGIDTSNYTDLTNFYIYYLHMKKPELRQL